MATKVRDILKRLNDDGWYLARTRGDHRVLKHPTKLGIVVIPSKPGDDIPPGTLGAIKRQAGLEETV